MVLADYKVPRRIDVVDVLPRNATGKVMKAQVRDRARGVGPGLRRQATGHGTLHFFYRHARPGT